MSKTQVDRICKTVKEGAGNTAPAEEETSTPQPRELIKPPPSRPGAAAREMLDKVATQQGEESLEALQRGRRLRERQEETDLLEREARIREQNADSLKTELEILVAKGKVSGPSEEQAQLVQELKTKLTQAERKAEEVQQDLRFEKLQRSFSEQIAGLRGELRTGLNEFDFSLKMGELIVPQIATEIRGIRQTIQGIFDRANNVPPKPAKPPITPEEAAQIAAKMGEGLDAPTPAQGAETSPDTIGRHNCLCGGRILIPREFEHIVDASGIFVGCGSCGRQWALGDFPEYRQTRFAAGEGG
ncbi:MAG: hypothetical protein HY673_09475 [Chloroflexi bacterium]|nr:hypothetical protein [Chloroflexota bacterium]